MYQGASDDFLGPYQDVPLRSEQEGIDFEGEFGVVIGPVAMGATPEEALRAVRLVVQLNDWSLRALGPHEMKTGFWCKPFPPLLPPLPSRPMNWVRPGAMVACRCPCMCSGMASVLASRTVAR
jgi:2-keto-4-pentenoate hydratase/2-oxohepta-3-ene-1,7-dioic acid hydratase in catechol pathway